MTGPAEPGPVVEVRYCPLCRQTLPIDHLCPDGRPVPCEAPPGDGRVCGECGACASAQVAYYAQRQDLIEHGHPADLDGGPR